MELLYKLEPAEFIATMCLPKEKLLELFHC